MTAPRGRIRFVTIPKLAAEIGVPARTLRRRLVALDQQSGGKVLRRASPRVWLVVLGSLEAFREGARVEDESEEAAAPLTRGDIDDLTNRQRNDRRDLRALAARVRAVEKQVEMRFGPDSAA